jgi:DNA-binding HxlR family transcriptional regulator
MQRKSFCEMDCSTAKALEEVGEWWSLLIVRGCTEGLYRFDDFVRELGITRNVLTARLQRLTDLGILERFPIQERINTDGYRLTPKGEGLYPVVIALMQWGDHWLVGDDKYPTALVEDATGDPVEPLFVHAKSGRRLSYKDVRYTPGPGATASTHTFIEGRNHKVLGGARRG